MSERQLVNTHKGVKRAAQSLASFDSNQLDGVIVDDLKLPGDLVRSANAVVRALRDYKVPVYVVRGGRAQEELIREIFKRLNTTGKALKEAEIFDALHGGKSAEGLTAISESLNSLGFGQLNENWLLKALAATLPPKSWSVAVLVPRPGSFIHSCPRGRSRTPVGWSIFSPEVTWRMACLQATRSDGRP